MKRTHRFAVTVGPVLAKLVLAGASLVACQTQPDRNLGDSLDDRSLDLNPRAANSEPFGVSPLEFVGRWAGVAEEPLALGGVGGVYRFPSGSTEFELEIRTPVAIGSASLRGSLVFGSGSPPPPLELDRGFPTDVDYAALAYFERNVLTASSYEGPLPPYEGYPYWVFEEVLPSSEGYDDSGAPLIADGVLQLGFDTGELLSPWCKQQTPQPTGSAGMSCVKGNSYLADDEGQCFAGFAELTSEQAADVTRRGVSLLTEAVDCDKLFLCSSSACECTEAGCARDPRGAGGPLGRLLLRRDGDGLTGVFSGTVFMNERQLPVPLGTLRFTRVE